LRPKIDHLESRALLSAAPMVAHPTFELERLVPDTSLPFGFSPAQVQTAYGFNNISFGGVAGDGSRETIAIVDAYDDPNIQSDLNTFDAQYGLPATTVIRVNETGGVTYPTSDQTGGWELEESLDVEWAHAMAPGAAIMLVEASSTYSSDLLTAVNFAASHANVVSMSWGGGEFPGETAYDSSYFEQAGVAFVASSGDDGAPASWPAASPDVLSVGGTALTLGPGNSWSSEIGWSGSGGGPSAYESQPSYQQGVVTQTSSARATPDVAYDASPSTGVAVYDSERYGGTTYGWLEVGGTSAGAPQWSALLAIADQGRALSGQPALDSASPEEVMNILYKNPADFHDITRGTSTGSPQHSAGPGYDYVTGLGSPMANLVVGSLDGAPSASYDKLVLAAPTAETAGTSFSLTVTAQNASGATDTSYVGTIHFTSSDVQAGLPANFTFMPADDGTATFTVTLKTAGSQSITATDLATPAVTGRVSGISVNPASASQLVLSGLSSTATAGVAQSFTVAAEDPYGNVATAYAGTVQVTSSDTQASLPANYTFTGADQGAHVFTLTFEAAGTQSVTVTDTSSGITADQSGITVHAAAAKIFTVTGFPVVDTAGAASNVTVTAYDAFGNVATGYTGTVSLASSDTQAILVPFRYAFVAADAGKHIFSVTLETAGTQTITATDLATASITGAESGITVLAAPASILKVTGFPTSDTAGTAGNLVVTAYDAYGNVATAYTGTVSLTSSDPQALLPSSFTFPGTTGTHTFPVTLETAGTQSITATDSVSPSITGAESKITVQAAAASILKVAGFPTTDTAGAAANFVVTAYDAYGNVATGYTGTVSLTSSDPQALLTSSYTFAAADAGKHTFSVTLETAGTQSITASDTVTPSLAAAESNIAVTPGAASILKVTGLPTSDTAGAAGNLVVTAYDAFGNVATGYIGTVSLTSSDPQALLPSSFTFAGTTGTHTFAVTLETAGTQSIAVTDTASASIAGAEPGITVQAAAASILKVTGFPTSDTAGAAGNFVVTAYDAYGNVATAYTGTVSLTSSDHQALLPSSFTFPGTTGTHTFAVTLETAGTQSITATDTASASIAGAEPGITVQAAAASILKVTGFPTSDTAGAAGNFVVTAYDAYGNVATGYTGTVSLTSSDPQALLTSSYTFAAADAGKHTFSVTLETAGTQSITASDTVTPSLTAAESNIAVTAGAASILKVTGFPASDTAGAAGNLAVTAYDAFGNVATAYTGTVSLTSSDPEALLPSSFTFPGTTGTHTFAVTLETAGTQSITATDTVSASMAGAESKITVRPAAASILKVTGFPTSDTAGAAGNLVVTAYDAYGNVATGYTGTVSLTSSDPQALLPSRFTFPGTAGTHMFAVTLETAGMQSITATDTVSASIAGAESKIAVQPAAAKTLTISGFPTSDIAGVAANVVVMAYDAYDNVATGYTGTVSLSSSDSQAILVPSSYTFAAADAGKHTFFLTLETKGTQTITATDTVTASLTATESGIMVRAVPQVTWSPLASIVYGTPLGTAQFDALANVPGTFTYTPAAGAILGAGSGQTLSVTFTPQDATHYTTAGATTTITVTKAAPILEVANAGGRFDGNAFPATVNVAGKVAGVDSTPASSLDNVTPSLTYYDGSGTAGTSLGPTPPSAPGTYTVVAAFPGDVNYWSVLSTPLTFTIGRGYATLALTGSGASRVYGQSVGFTATVGAFAGVPSGTVTFSDGATRLATVPLDGFGTAAFTTSALSLGSHSITATYSGDVDTLGVQSAPYSMAVGRTGTTVVVVEQSNFAGKRLTSVSLAAQVKPLAPGGGIPTGDVTFELVTKTKNKVTVTKLGRATVIGGQATLTLKANTVLQRAITIVYSGDGNDKPSSIAMPKMT